MYHRIHPHRHAHRHRQGIQYVCRRHGHHDYRVCLGSVAGFAAADAAGGQCGAAQAAAGVVCGVCGRACSFRRGLELPRAFGVARADCAHPRAVLGHYRLAGDAIGAGGQAAAGFGLDVAGHFHGHGVGLAAGAAGGAMVGLAVYLRADWRAGLGRDGAAGQNPAAPREQKRGFAQKPAAVGQTPAPVGDVCDGGTDCERAFHGL